jgi:hypothetical protein
VEAPVFANMCGSEAKHVFYLLYGIPERRRWLMGLGVHREVFGSQILGMKDFCVSKRHIHFAMRQISMI